MPPDYSRQLQEIANALNRPNTPTWVIAVFSALIGAIATILVQVLLLRLSDARRRAQMRRLVYSELEQQYVAIRSSLEYCLSKPKDELRQFCLTSLKRTLSISRTAKYIDSNLELFVQLPESGGLETIFALFDLTRASVVTPLFEHTARSTILETNRFMRQRSRRAYCRRYMHDGNRFDDDSFKPSDGYTMRFPKADSEAFGLYGLAPVTETKSGSGPATR